MRGEAATAAIPVAAIIRWRRDMEVIVGSPLKGSCGEEACVLFRKVSQVTAAASTATWNVTTRPLRSEHPANALSRYAQAHDAVSTVGVTLPWRDSSRSSLKSDLLPARATKKGAARKPPL